MVLKKQRFALIFMQCYLSPLTRENSYKYWWMLSKSYTPALCTRWIKGSGVSYNMTKKYSATRQHKISKCTLNAQLIYWKIPKQAKQWKQIVVGHSWNFQTLPFPLCSWNLVKLRWCVWLDVCNDSENPYREKLLFLNLKTLFKLWFAMDLTQQTEDFSADELWWCSRDNNRTLQVA